MNCAAMRWKRIHFFATLSLSDSVFLLGKAIYFYSYTISKNICKNNIENKYQLCYYGKEMINIIIKTIKS